MIYRPEDIFTPQGTLEEVEKNPNLDFLMNIFNIPRAFGVSGFGEGWNVGKHSMATAFLALFWAKFNKFPTEKRDRLTTLALLHDMHEAVTGDILPMFKAKQVKEQLNKIQENIIHGLGVKDDVHLEVDLKIIDLIAFLYEIKQVSPSILNAKQLNLAHVIAEKQRIVLFEYCKEMGVEKSKVQRFLKLIEI
ncbi:MAG: HD domain-containing protein [Candidatus Woesebacteria bacterium]